ncbi:dienelactone hydrolase family-domain-containing protein [Suillus paluster]|uniref:dienelactone hydrolase family-domain-containing protein n=1 Tax=Suillus paluster TaxID=48578 RepID=UPI001B881C81|nr:dienelactone hydrolase family-domain-containing protein [Suillus paluster]KAG1742663.1 dienelactone hydrolase family-domain-containing protein [Suillus paluster]
MSPTLASAPGSCCFGGVKHAGTPVGRIEDLGGLQTYISEPPTFKLATTQKVILYLADVWGPLYLNNQLIQDYFASCGYIVLGPDYFFGNAISNHPPGFDRPTWIVNARKAAFDAFPAWLDAVKAKYGSDTKYCTVGYCFGAPFVMDLCSNGSVVAGALAHPAFLEERHFEKLAGPLILSCAEEDHTFPHASRRRAEDIMVARKCTYYFQVFSGVKHGFAVKGDPDVEMEREWPYLIP